MTEFLPPQRLPWVDGQGLPLKAVYTWAEGISRAVGTPPDVGATGTAQNYDVGAQGAKVPLLEGFGSVPNIWSGVNVYTQAVNTLVSYKVAGIKVVGVQQAAVADAVHSAAAPTQAEFNAAVDQLNSLLAKLRTHGLIAT